MAIIRKQDNFKVPIRAATTSDITLSGLQTIDEVTLNFNDRVLVKDQVDSTQNGVYLCKPDTWVRAEEFDQNAELLTGTVLFVSEGTKNGNTFWITYSNAMNITVGVSNIYFKNISDGAGSWEDLENKPTTVSEFGITDAVTTDKLGVANGVATLDDDSKIPAIQLPIDVDNF